MSAKGKLFFRIFQKYVVSGSQVSFYAHIYFCSNAFHKNFRHAIFRFRRHQTELTRRGSLIILFVLLSLDISFKFLIFRIYFFVYILLSFVDSWSTYVKLELIRSCFCSFSESWGRGDYEHVEHIVPRYTDLLTRHRARIGVGVFRHTT